MEMRFTLFLVPLLAAILGLPNVYACRLNSELLKGYTRKTIDRLLSPEQLSSIYWPDEPLPVHSLAKAIGVNVTMAETHFNLGSDSQYDSRKNEIDGTGLPGPSRNGSSVESYASMIQDIFVTCSIDRDRSYALSINLEIENPFKEIDIYYHRLGPTAKRRDSGEKVGSFRRGRTSSFRISLPQSSLLVQLNQRLRYDDCLSVNYVQLAPSVDYLIECPACDKSDQEFLDKIFHKRMSQLDAELDAILSEKVLFGLQVLLSKQRLDLDTYMA